MAGGDKRGVWLRFRSQARKGTAGLGVVREQDDGTHGQKEQTGFNLQEGREPCREEGKKCVIQEFGRNGVVLPRKLGDTRSPEDPFRVQREGRGKRRKRNFGVVRSLV